MASERFYGAIDGEERSARRPFGPGAPPPQALAGPAVPAPAPLFGRNRSKGRATVLHPPKRGRRAGSAWASAGRAPPAYLAAVRRPYPTAGGAPIMAASDAREGPICAARSAETPKPR